MLKNTLLLDMWFFFNKLLYAFVPLSKLQNCIVLTSIQLQISWQLIRKQLTKQAFFPTLFTSHIIHPSQFHRLYFLNDIVLM